jgi:hypothetical protein
MDPARFVVARIAIILFPPSRIYRVMIHSTYRGMAATKNVSHKDTKHTKDFYYNEPKNVLFFVFFAASCD